MQQVLDLYYRGVPLDRMEEKLNVGDKELRRYVTRLRSKGLWQT